MLKTRSFLCVAVGVLAACGGAGVPAPAAAPSPADPCIAGSSSRPGAADTLVVAASGTVASRDVPVPRSPAERFAFAQVYETLVRVDCEGRIAPGLAERWHADRAARTWTFFLRSDATFADGLPVSAADVVVSWEARAVPGPW
ncbi:MAG TPA: ABC transporter substrate-binding protein, partial [Gemmatimonadales bacterium]|nr:ABC transporter substrate-binding protein [Gemmatimonadales bacterium]